MNLRLRRAHLLAMSAATLVAGAGLAAAAATAVGAHPVGERAYETPEALMTLAAPPLPDGSRMLCEVARVWADPPTTARLYAVPPDGPALLELQPLDTRDAPDTLVYWSPAGDTLGQAYLLGAAPRRLLCRYPLPDVARAGGGRLLLWSLGHHALLAAGSLPGAPASAAPSGAPSR